MSHSSRFSVIEINIDKGKLIDKSNNHHSIICFCKNILKHTNKIVKAYIMYKVGIIIFLSSSFFQNLRNHKREGISRKMLVIITSIFDIIAIVSYFLSSKNKRKIVIENTSDMALLAMTI
jgi:hypothetical protein